ncbi:MAG: DUF4435 domain-containing protein [bacterium]
MSISLKNAQTPKLRVGEIIQKMKTPQDYYKVLILVEGKDDKSYYKQFFEESEVQLEQCNGCRPEIELHDYLSESGEVKTFFTIKDADFDRLMQAEYTHPDNLFITDKHDLEISYFINFPLISSFLKDNYNLQVNAGFLDLIFEELKQLSLYKFYNQKFSRGVRFDKPKITEKHPNGFDEISKLLDLYRCKDVSEMPTEEELRVFCSENANCCIEQLTNGHDFISRMIYAIKHKYKYRDNSVKHENITKLLTKKSFEDKIFQTSQMYKDIQEWQEDKGVEILKG